MNVTTNFEKALFELNMGVCKKSRPALYSLLNTTDATDRYCLFQSEHDSGAYNLIDIKNDTLFYEQSDPIGSMANHIETCINKLQGIMLCLGFGLGYSPLMLVQQKNYVTRSIIIVEPDPEVLLMAFRALDCRAILESKDVLLLVGFELSDISTAVTSHLALENRFICARNLQIIDLPAAYSTDRQYFDQAIKRVSHAILEGVRVYGNCPEDALHGLDTSLSNYSLHVALPGIKPLADQFKGKPGIVVAAGPSLDKNIHLLKGLEDKAVIVGVDASLPHLQKKNLKAHFATSVERVEATSRFFEDLDPTTYEETFLVGSPVCHPATFEKYKGPIISCEREHGYTRLLDLDKGMLQPGPSAGNMAYRLLTYLGCDPIILIGQDLALSEDGRTHAKGNVYGDQQQGYLFEPIEVEGNFCKVLKSNPILRMFHYGYEHDISVGQSMVINATEGGAKINGTQVLSLQDTIDQFITAPIFNPDSGMTVPEYIASRLETPAPETVQLKIADFKVRLIESIAYLKEVGGIVDTAKKNVSLFEEHLKTAEIGAVTPTGKGKKTKDELLGSLNAISALHSDPIFRMVAQDVVSSVFLHTMMDYNSALANAKDTAEQDAELVRNVENLANNIGVLNRYILALLEGHLNILQQSSDPEDPPMTAVINSVKTS